MDEDACHLYSEYPTSKPPLDIQPDLSGEGSSPRGSSPGLSDGERTRDFEDDIQYEIEMQGDGDNVAEMQVLQNNY